MDRKTVVVTGFGSFHDYIVNPSWEVVSSLRKTGIVEELNINLITPCIPVCYKDVDRMVPNLWSQHDPELMVHLGVSPLAETLTIELIANSHGYCCKDINGQFPDDESPLHNVIATGLKLDCSDELDICMSEDAGRYLCEYIYYKSLSINKNKTILIHVPARNDKNTPETLAENLKYIIAKLLEQVTE